MKGEWEAVSQAFVSGCCVQDSSGCRGGLMSYGRVSLSGDLAHLPRVWGHFVGKLESCFLAQVSLQERASRAEPWVRATENLEIW